MGSFSYTPRAFLCGELLLHSPCSFMWGVSLTRPVLFYLRSFSCTLRALLCGEFLLHAPRSVMWGVSLTLSVLFYVGSFSYTPRALLCGEFLLYSPCSFMWGVSLTCPVLFYVENFSYTPRALLCGEFLLHSPCSFMWGVSLTRPCSFIWVISLSLSVLFYVGSFSYTPRALLCEEFLVHIPRFCCHRQKQNKKMQEHGQSGEVCVPRLRSSQCRDHMATLPWFWPDAQHVGDCGHRLLRRHFTMDRHSWSGIASVQTAGRQRLRADVTCVPAPAVLISVLFFSCHWRFVFCFVLLFPPFYSSFAVSSNGFIFVATIMLCIKIITLILFDTVLLYSGRGGVRIS